jgi:hypothetical protein
MLQYWKRKTKNILHLYNVLVAALPVLHDISVVAFPVPHACLPDPFPVPRAYLQVPFPVPRAYLQSPFPVHEMNRQILLCLPSVCRSHLLTVCVNLHRMVCANLLKNPPNDVLLLCFLLMNGNRLRGYLHLLLVFP